MRRPGIIKITGLFLLLLLTGLLFPSGGCAAEEVKPPKYIFLISIDGLTQEGYTTFEHDNITSLALDGVSTDRCLAVKADTIEAGEASLFTGSFPEEHKHYGYRDKVAAESLLEVFGNDDRSFLVVDGSGGKLRGFSRGENEYLKLSAGMSDTDVMKKATDRFLARKQFFTYIYLNDCRSTVSRTSNREFYNKLRRIDIAVGKLVLALKEYSLYDSSAIIITSARSSSNSDMVPLIIKAPSLKSNYSINGTCVVDVAPTMCYMMDLKAPMNSSGLVMWNAFEGRKEKNAQSLVYNRIDDLQKERLMIWKKYYEMVKQRDSYSHQIEEIKEERENIFNFAGEKERTIASLKNTLERGKNLITGLTIVFLIGYMVEYRLLKRKFLLFK